MKSQVVFKITAPIASQKEVKLEDEIDCNVIPLYETLGVICASFASILTHVMSQKYKMAQILLF